MRGVETRQLAGGNARVWKKNQLIATIVTHLLN